MKNLKCDLCEFVASGETFDDWMNALKPHYAEAHADFMQASGKLSEAQQKEEMEKWMSENKARFNAA